MDKCMEEAGFPEWDWSVPRSKNPPSVGLKFSVFFAPPMSSSHSSTLMATAPAVKADSQALHTDMSAAERVAADSCSGRVEEVSAASTPSVALRLKEEWWTFLADVDGKYGSLDEYRQCLASSDMGALGRVTSTDEAAMALYRLNPSAEQLPVSQGDPLTQSPAWQRLVDAESQWEQTEFACRQQVYNEHLADVVNDAQRFAESRADRIAEARNAWEQIVARATVLGYDGTYASLDPVR